MATKHSMRSTMYVVVATALLAAYLVGYGVVSDYEVVEREDLSKFYSPPPRVASHERHFRSHAWRFLYRPMVRLESLLSGREISARTLDELAREREHFGMEEFIVPDSR